MLNVLRNKKDSLGVFNEYLDVCYSRALQSEVYCDYPTCFQARDQTGLTVMMIDRLVNYLPFRVIFNSLKDKSRQNIVRDHAMFNKSYKPVLANIKIILNNGNNTKNGLFDLLSDFNSVLASQNAFRIFHYPSKAFDRELIDAAWPGVYYKLVPELKFNDMVTAFYLATDAYRNANSGNVLQNNQSLNPSGGIKDLSKNYLLRLPEKVTIDNLVEFSRTGLNGLPRVNRSSNMQVTQNLLEQF